MRDYQFYTEEDFALDEDFQNWVLDPDVKNKYFPEAWLQEHPEKSEAVNKAIILVRSIQFHPYILPENEKKQLWNSVWDKMEQEEEEEEVVPQLTTVKKINMRRDKWRYVIAAVFIGLIVMSVIWLKMDHSSGKMISFDSQTGFGEVKKLILPDSSEVILNADSRLVYSEKNNTEREVWIAGEAYFHVRHTSDNKKFIVHTFDNLSVEVLGTTFNVNSRGDQIAVVLQEGSIKLEINEAHNKVKTQLYLKPGEMVSYNKKEGDYTKTNVDTDIVNSWAAGKLMMNNYSLKDAAVFIGQVFGKKLIIHNRSLINKRISGSMPIIYNMDTMLVQFGKVFNVHFHKKDNEIWIQK